MIITSLIILFALFVFPPLGVIADSGVSADWLVMGLTLIALLPELTHEVRYTSTQQSL